MLTVFVETVPEGCIKHDVMTAIDTFAWQIRNLAGVQSVLTLPHIAKVINAGWNEGSLKWRVLPRNQQSLVQATSPIETSSGMLNKDCSVIPVLIFTSDHKAETISSIVAAVKDLDAQYGSERIRYQLAGSNVGVMAATNEAVEAAQFPMLFYVFGAIIVLCLLSFRSLAGTVCIIVPLALVSLLAYALMSYLEIGLKVNTLPVVALGVGIGVDYGIYIFSRFQGLLAEDVAVVGQVQRVHEVFGILQVQRTGLHQLTQRRRLAAGRDQAFSPCSFRLTTFSRSASMIASRSPCSPPSMSCSESPIR